MLLDEIGARLTAQAVATTGGTGASAATMRLVYREFQPTPEWQLVLTPSGGFQGEGRPELDRPTFQVRVRGAESASTTLEVKTAAVVTALHQFAGTLSGRYYVDIARQGDTLYLGRDENQRPIYALNFLALRSRT